MGNSGIGDMLEVAKMDKGSFQSILTKSFATKMQSNLRILVIHDAKLHQNLLIHDISKIQGAFFDNLSGDGKSGVKVEKRTQTGPILYP